MRPRLVADIRAFTYPDGTQALGDLTLELDSGEFAGILGANGSGKTTLLKVLDGLLTGFEGGVALDGRDIKTLSPREIYRRMGLVFQNPDEQLFGSSVFEDVAFGPRNMGFPEPEVRRRVCQALGLVDLEELENKGIHQLSYGQKKRACLAGMLAMGQEILLLDEPTAGLDPMGEYGMMHLLTRLNREEGTTILMATHSVDLVPLFLSRLYIISRGRIIREGRPEEVFTAPEEMKEVKLRLPYIAELIHKLKHEDHLPFERLPLTVGEARREILKLHG
jgi:cobalt/nickel transport system ATP-binding protein